MVRTRNEEAVLQRDLPGYADYAQQVRFRLVPLIWWQVDLKEAALWSKGNN